MVVLCFAKRNLLENTILFINVLLSTYITSPPAAQGFKFSSLVIQKNYVYLYYYYCSKHKQLTRLSSQRGGGTAQPELIQTTLLVDTYCSFDTKHLTAFNNLTDGYVVYFIYIYISKQAGVISKIITCRWTVVGLKY